MDKKNYFPTWLEEFNRFKALKSEFFLYGNIYDCYYFPINYKTVTNSDELKFAKFNDIKELLKKFLKERCTVHILEILKETQQNLKNVHS